MNFDCYGWCSLCHQCLLVTDKNDKGQLIERLSGKAEHMDVNLNDGSKMRVLICADCKSNYSHEKHSSELMTSVIKGWEKECEQLVADETKSDWTQEKKEKFMDVYSKKQIILEKEN